MNYIVFGLTAFFSMFIETHWVYSIIETLGIGRYKPQYGFLVLIIKYTAPLLITLYFCKKHSQFRSNQSGRAARLLMIAGGLAVVVPDVLAQLSRDLFVGYVSNGTLFSTSKVLELCLVAGVVIFLVSINETRVADKPER